MLKLFRKIISRILIGIIRLYQGAISPFFRGSCRFTPSCSQYGIKAIKKYGPLKGGFLTVKRLLRCHPWGGHGYDPLP